MSRFRTYSQIFSGEVPEDFGVSHVKGSSLTIPGQGCDLEQIIESIVKLPPLDERTFDVPAGQDPDTRALSVKVDLDELYVPEGVALAESVQERRKAAKEAKEAKEGEGSTTEGGETTTE